MYIEMQPLSMYHEIITFVIANDFDDIITWRRFPS